MKKKILIITVVFFLISTAAWAHSPLLYVEDNYDGTITVEGGFSNGASVAGLPVLIVEAGEYDGPDKSFEGKRILFETKFDDIGLAELVKPDVKKYIVVFNGGAGHVATLIGPALEDDEREDWQNAINDKTKELGQWKDYITGKK